MMNDFPCTCGHLAEQHDFDQVAQKHTACLVKDGKTNDHYMYNGLHIMGYVDDCGQFAPIDNLDYLEIKYNNAKK